MARRSRLPFLSGRSVYPGWWIVGAAMVAQFVSIGMHVFVTPLFLKPMTESLGWDRADFIVATTIGQFVMGGIGFSIGGYLDRYGARPLMLIGATVLGISTFSLGFVDELWQWLLLRGVVSTIGAALIGNLVVNVTLSKWFVEQRGRMIGIASIGLSIGGLIMPPLMSPIIENYSWEVAWRVLGLITLVLMYPSALLMRRQPEDYGLYPDGKTAEEVRQGGGRRAQQDYANSFTRREALATPQLYLLVVAFALSGAGITTVLSQGTAFLTDSDFSAGTAALMLSVYSILGAGSRVAWGYFADRSHARYLAAITFAMAFVAVLLIVVAAQTGSLAVLIAGYALFGSALSGQQPIQETIWGTYFGRRYLGQVRSVAMPISLVISASVPVLTAIYFDRAGSYEVPFLVISAFWILGAGIVLLARQPRLPARLREGEAVEERAETPT
ncbi:MAG: MFS transporter [Dehalococcoidia bacterium]|nr:MFS transporter [Dehalococcoidia bacterium]